MTDLTSQKKFFFFTDEKNYPNKSICKYQQIDGGKFGLYLCLGQDLNLLNIFLFTELKWQR